MISSPDFILKDLEDDLVRENFKRLSGFLEAFPFFRGEWRFFTITISAAVTNLKIAHGLKFKPLDLIETSKTGAGVITYNFDKFDETTIDVTTTGACSIRCFIGAYKEESGRSGR